MLGVFLKKDFRTKLFYSLYVKCDCSSGYMGKTLGYKGNAKNVPVRRMWTGEVSIPLKKIPLILELTNTDSNKFYENVIDENDELLDMLEEISKFKTR